MASAPVIAAMTGIQMGMTYLSGKNASDAAKAESKYRQQTYKNAETAHRDALKKNTDTRLEERERTLSELRVRQAAQGFDSSKGTPLMVFGDFKSRIDEQIDESTNQGISQIYQIKNKAKMDKFTTKNQLKQMKMEMFGKMASQAIEGGMKAKGMSDWSKQNTGNGTPTSGQQQSPFSFLG